MNGFYRSKRLVLAKEGKLFAGNIINGELMLTELADFNANKPYHRRAQLGVCTCSGLC